MNLQFQQFLPMLDSAPSQNILRRVSPLPKVCFTLGFLVLTVSFNSYDWLGAALFALMPFFLAAIGGLSVLRLLRRTLIALPFVLCAGIVNLFFDTAQVTILDGITISGGVLSLFVLIAKTLATVGLVLTLTAVTPMREISGALVRLHLPCILVLQIQLLFRYLFVLVEEARNVTNAYFLRNPNCRIVPLNDWGILIGRLFLRSVERANAIYRTMQCRLFHAGRPLPLASDGSSLEWECLILLFCGLCFLRFTI